MPKCTTIAKWFCFKRILPVTASGRNLPKKIEIYFHEAICIFELFVGGRFEVEDINMYVINFYTELMLFGFVIAQVLITSDSLPVENTSSM